MVFLCPYVFPVYLLPFASFWGCFFGFLDFDRQKFLALGGVANRKWRHHSIPRPHFCIRGLFTSCVYLFSFKSYSTFSFGLEIPRGAEISEVFGISRPLSACVHQQDPEKAPPCVKPRRLSRHTCLYDAPFGRYAIARKKIKKKISKEKSHEVVIFHVCVGRPYPTDWNGSWHIGLAHQHYQLC
jgi:hypothetical protein